MNLFDFERNVIDCILQYNCEVEVDSKLSHELVCKTVYIRDKNIIIHLLPVPFAGLHKTPADYFQKKSLEYAKQGIQLIHLWQDYWITRQDIVRSRIAVLSGSSIRIHARKTKVKRIAKDEARGFFTANHMQGAVNARHNYGLYSDGQLVAAASFSAGLTVIRNGIAGRSYELLRSANLLHHVVIGGLSKLISCFVKDVNPDDIMTYADFDWASGKGYCALNFTQMTVTTPQVFWIHPAEMKRYYSHRLPEQLTHNFQNQNNYSSMGVFLKDMGYINIYNAGNLKYLLIRGY